MSNSKINILHIEDTEDESYAEHTKNSLISEVKELFREINYRHLVIMTDGGTTDKFIERLKNEIRKADVVVFDMGGFQQIANCGGGQCVVDYWNRFFVDQIENHPSKDWRCISNIDTFEDEDRKRLEELGVKFRW